MTNNHDILILFIFIYSFNLLFYKLINYQSMKTLIKSLAMLVILLGISGCEGLRDDAYIEIKLLNNSMDPVHLWVDNTESIDPSNRVNPGLNRTVTVKPVENPATINVFAGRNGETLTSTSFEANMGAKVKVIFDGYSLSAF